MSLLPTIGARKAEVIVGCALGCVFALMIIQLFLHFRTERTRGGVPCGRWFAECVMRNDMDTCTKKAVYLGCPVESAP